MMVIGKGGRERRKKENFRGIWVMKMDGKMVNKIVGKEMEEEMKKVMEDDEVGLMGGMEGWLNIGK